ncbi:MAG: Fic family protein, partial [Chlamydiia bacterium]|nr:Fic family protein [Chlamydiia bacterium]
YILIPLDQKLADRAVTLDLPLSEAGKILYRAISRPLNERPSCYYRREFLDSYIPNQSAYLTDQEKAQLLEMNGPSKRILPAGTYAREIYNRLLIDLSWNSSRLEGNTYSLLETERLLNLGEQVDSKSAQEAHMLLNHKDAIEFLIENAEEISYNAMTIRNMHALLSDTLLGDSGASGRIRSIPINISGTKFKPCNTPSILEECFEELLKKAALINDPFEVSFFLLVHIPYLQPFEDVNKRTARIACNIPLIKSNLCPISFVDVSLHAYISAMLGVYELNEISLLKDVFLWAYKRSTQRYAHIQHQVGEPDPLRVRHRMNIRSLVKEIVEKGLDRLQATKHIQGWASEHLDHDKQRFIEAVEQELLQLNIGNIARYKLHPSIFNKWSTIWNRPNGQ